MSLWIFTGAINGLIYLPVFFDHVSVSALWPVFIRYPLKKSLRGLVQTAKPMGENFDIHKQLRLLHIDTGYFLCKMPVHSYTGSKL